MAKRHFEIHNNVGQHCLKTATAAGHCCYGSNMGVKRQLRLEVTTLKTSSTGRAGDCAKVWCKNGKLPSLHKRRGFTLTLKQSTPLTPPPPNCGMSILARVRVVV